MTTFQALLFDLIKATKPSEVDVILQQIGDYPGVSADQPFGENGFVWSFYGGNESNLSTIHLGSKPDRSLTERVTNAIDAILEKRMSQGGPVPASPMEAAKTWFGRPPTTSDNGLFNWKEYGVSDYDRLVQVVITPADDKSEPTVDIIDAGIGIKPEEFGDTILSLQHGNKVKKSYLVGAFGQGGAATIRYSKYTLIISRHVEAPNMVGFTLVKLLKLPEPYKVDAYVYLSLRPNGGKITVPSCRVDDVVDFFPSIPNHGVKFWETGTLVRHYGYALKGLENPLQATPGNLYHALQCMMFDPLLPFRLIDLRQARKTGRYKNEVIRGSRNRLMNYTLTTPPGPEIVEDAEETGTGEAAAAPSISLRHHVPRQMVSLRNDSSPCVGIEYWVIRAERKTGDKITLRPSSELFVDRQHPILGTLHGQNQGEKTETLFRELDLSAVSKHIVVHIDASNADKETRQGLFVSTREGFSQGAEYTELERLLNEIFRDDDELYEIENELLEALINRQTASMDSELKKDLGELLKDAGLHVSQPGSTTVPGEGTEQTRPILRGRRGRHPEPPLPTLPYPQATKFEIVYPETKFEIPLNERHVVKIETDANFRFDREGRLAIRAEPNRLEVASKSELRSGRLKWRLRPTADATAGDAGEIIATLTVPNGSQLEARLQYEVLPSREVKAKKAKGELPDFDVLPIDPYNENDRALLEQLWPNVKPEEIPNLAYKAEKFAGKLIVYYSIAFTPFREQFEHLKNQAALAQLFQHEYKMWIGYHAILQFMAGNHLDYDFEPDPDARNALDKYGPQIEAQAHEKDRALVAEMQVKQAIKTAVLKNESMRDSAR